MYASHASPWPLNHWTNTGVACAFWSGMCIASFPGSCGTRLLACATKYRKFEKESKAYVFRWKSSRDREHIFGPHRTWGYGRLSRRPHALFASLGAAALSRTHRSRCGLHGVVAAFTLYSCLLFHFRTRLLALPCSHHNFCHFDIKTMRPLALLQRWEWYTYVSVHNLL